jgi:hypothetical protein
MSPCKHWKTIADAVMARKSRSFLANFNTYYEEKIDCERRTEKYPFSYCGSKIRRVIEQRKSKELESDNRLKMQRL